MHDSELISLFDDLPTDQIDCAVKVGDEEFQSEKKIGNWTYEIWFNSEVGEHFSPSKESLKSWKKEYICCKKNGKEVISQWLRFSKGDAMVLILRYSY